MATELKMPKLGLTMVTGQLVKWLKNEGERVEKGEAVAEVMTDKCVSEVEAPASGVILKIKFQEGEEIPVGETLAIIGEPGENVEIWDSLSPGAPSRLVREESLLRSLGDSPDFTRPAGQEEEGTERMKVSPLARKLAQELGVDLAEVKGTGPGGRIEKEDILTYANARKSQLGVAIAVASRQRMVGMRRVIAERLTSSYQQVPHVYFHTEADVSKVLDWRQKLNEISSIRISLTDFLVKASASALKEYPQVNASVQQEEILFFADINVGIAVALDNGLVVPVIRNAEQKDLLEIAQERNRLVARARSGELEPETLQGGTFTISNLGPFGITSFTAIINPPQAAILAVGRVCDAPVVENGQIVIKPIMHLTLGVDHRLIDGAVAAGFIGLIKRFLEEPHPLLGGR